MIIKRSEETDEEEDWVEVSPVERKRLLTKYNWLRLVPLSSCVGHPCQTCGLEYYSPVWWFGTRALCADCLEARGSRSPKKARIAFDFDDEDARIAQERRDAEAARLAQERRDAEASRIAQELRVAEAARIVREEEAGRALINAFPLPIELVKLGLRDAESKGALPVGPIWNRTWLAPDEEWLLKNSGFANRRTNAHS